MEALKLSELAVTWHHLETLAPEVVQPITTEEDYDRVLALLRQVMLEIGQTENHPLESLAASLTTRAVAWQDAAGHLPPASPDMELRLLMKERGVTQQQLAAATGIDQAQISKLASGKRPFTTAHIRALSTYFGVNPTVFLAPSAP